MISFMTKSCMVCLCLLTPHSRGPPGHARNGLRIPVPPASIVTVSGDSPRTPKLNQGFKGSPHAHVIHAQQQLARDDWMGSLRLHSQARMAEVIQNSFLITLVYLHN